MTYWHGEKMLPADLIKKLKCHGYESIVYMIAMTIL